MKKSTLSYEKARLKELLWLMVEKYQPTCSICHQPFKREDILPPRGADQLTEHHVDGNHYNAELVNRELVHRECHKRHHSKNNINFWRQFR